MKAKVLTLILCFTALLASAENGNDTKDSYKYAKKRTIDANFEVTDNYTLSLIGRYSDYKISAWNESYVSFHIEIITQANKQEMAEDMLYAIDVDFDHAKRDKKIKAKTVINKNDIKNVGFQISYYVMLPQDIYISVYNQYGDVQVDKANNIYVEMNYGDLSIDEILSNAEINILYGDADVKNANNIAARMSYGDIDIANVNNASINMNYGSAKLDAVAYLNGKFNYSDVEIGSVGKTADININYGDIKVNNDSTDFELIKVNANYSDIDLHLDDAMSFSYDVTLLYGNVKNGLMENHAKRITEKNYQLYMTGNVNDGNNQHQIIIIGNYTDVK